MRCPECKNFMASTTTQREEAQARADVRMCTSCGKVQQVLRPAGPRQPDIRLRSRLLARAQRYSRDFKEGRMTWNGTVFIWPASKGGPRRGG